MVCVNCGVGFDEESKGVGELLLPEVATETRTQGDVPLSKRLTVMDACATIFELTPLQAEEKESVFKNEDDDSFLLCSPCGDHLTSLYSAFYNFLQVLKMEGELAKKLKGLMEVRYDGQKKSPPTKRGSKKKKAVVKEEADEEGRRRRGKKRKLSDEDEDENDRALISGDLDLLDLPSDNESVIEDEIRGNLSDDFTPPDSPINMEDIPRSPRPVRKSSARNRDWAAFYKDDDDIFEEEVAVPLEAPIDSNPDPDPSKGQEVDPLAEEALANETEVTATEGEEEELPDPEAQQILEKVQVAWEEDRDRDLEFHDEDDDEDYHPDSDIENLLAETEEYFKRSSKRSSSYFECDDCGKVFAHRSSLQIHRRVHDREGPPIPCPTCGTLYPTEEGLRRHRRKVHDEYIPYKRRNEEDMDLEALMNDDINKLECPVCEVIVSQGEIQSHVDDAHPEVEEPWKCERDSCSKVFSTFQEFSRHKTRLHFSKSGQEHPCPVCGIVFRSLFHLTKHQEGRHLPKTEEGVEGEDLEEGGLAVGEEVGKGKFKCSECGKRYVKVDKLTEHLIIHGIGDKFRCEECGREFTHLTSKRRHMYLHSQRGRGGSGTGYPCEEEGCEKVFSRNDHLIRHMDSIHGVKVLGGHLTIQTGGKKVPKAKEIPCRYCGKIIKRERMRLHLVSHTGERRHVCKQCGQKFGLRTTLRTHIQCVHQDLRRHKCSFCPMAFKRSNHLKDHLKLHTEAENKPFVCDVCSKSFRREKNLKSHMVTHTGGKDYMCDQCGKSFNRIDNMRAHVRSVHEGIQIRKKRTRKREGISGKGKKGQQAPDDPSSLSSVVEEEIEIKFPTLEAVVVPEGGEGAVNSPLSESSRPSETPSKKSYQGRKGRGKAVAAEAAAKTVPVPVEINNETGAVEAEVVEVPQPGTIVTLALDSSGNVISTTEGLEGLPPHAHLQTVRLEDIEAEVDADGRPATIVQITPGGTVFSNNGQLTTYYQYTYYQPE